HQSHDDRECEGMRGAAVTPWRFVRDAVQETDDVDVRQHRQRRPRSHRWPVRTLACPPKSARRRRLLEARRRHPDRDMSEAGHVKERTLLESTRIYNNAPETD